MPQLRRTVAAANHRRAMAHQLEKIYEDESGHLPNIGRLQPTRKRGIIRFAFRALLVLVVLASVAWAGFFFFTRYAPPAVRTFVGGSSEMKLEIVAPEQATSGEMVTYTINYKNLSRQELRDVTLSVRYPSGFILQSAQPAVDAATDEVAAAPRHEDTWSVGKIGVDASGQLSLTGQLLAAAGTNQNMFVVLYYTPANFSSQFQTEASATTNISASPLVFTVDGPEQVTTTDPVQLVVGYENTSDEAIEQLTLELIFPDGFAIDKLDTAPTNGQYRWLLPRLEPKQKGELFVQGKFAANGSGALDLVARATVNRDGQDFLLGDLTRSFTVTAGDLQVELKRNGSSDNSTVAFGDLLSYSLTYANAGAKPLEHLTATVFFTSSAEFVEWGTLSDRYDGTLDEFEAGKYITWTEAEVPNLVKLNPGDKGVIDFSVKLSSTAGALAGDVTLNNIGSVKVETIGGKKANLEARSNAITTKLNSNLMLEATGRYFGADGSPVGSGPLPPKQDQTTEYVINWQVTNSVHEVSDVAVSTVLPEGVKWVGTRDLTVGEVEYQPASHRVIWTVNRMPLTVNLDYRANFAVSITPQGRDVGKILVLTGDQTVTATDTVTAGQISQTRGSITTDLVADPLAKGKGLVTGVE